jgi:hypothetical protein
MCHADKKEGEKMKGKRKKKEGKRSGCRGGGKTKISQALHKFWGAENT